MRLEGKGTAITGTASGIGRATAVRFAAEGARVGLLDVDDGGNETTLKTILDAGGTARAAHCDVTDETSVVEAFRALDEAIGPVDVVHANAGIELLASILDTTAADWDRVHSVNCRGVFLTAREGVARMVDRGGGSLIVTASTAGMNGAQTQAAYGSAKAAVVNLVKNVAVDFAAAGIRANAIAPGIVETPLLAKSYGLEEVPPEMLAMMHKVHPIGRMASADDIASAAVFLASEESAQITGTVIVVDGGILAGPRVDSSLTGAS